MEPVSSSLISHFLRDELKIICSGKYLFSLEEGVRSRHTSFCSLVSESRLSSIDEIVLLSMLYDCVNICNPFKLITNNFVK